MMGIIPWLLAFRFYLIPVLIGRAIMIGLKGGSRHQLAHESWLDAALYFLMGTITVFGVAMGVRYGLTYFLPTVTFQTGFFSLISMISLICLALNVWRFPKVPRLTTESWLVPSIILGSSVLTYAIWMWRSPYPLNWDLYEHQTLAHLIQTGSFNFFTSKISDTFGFNSYPPVFHSLLAISQYGLNLNPSQILSYWNALSFWHLVTVSIASYALGLALTGKKQVGILSCLIGTLIFDSVISLTSLFILPQTLTATLAVLLIAQVLMRSHQQRRVPVLTAVLVALSLVLNHYVIGTAAAALYLVTYGYYSFPTTIDRIMNTIPVVEIFIVCCVGGLLASQVINLNSLNSGEAASYVFTISQKLQFIQQIYGFSWFLLLPLGAFAAIKHRSRSMTWLLLISVGFLAILASHFPYALKFYVLGRFIFHAIMALGIWALLDTTKHKLTAMIGTSVLIGMLALLLVLNSLNWKQGLFGDHQQLAHVSQDDIAAAQFIADTYPPVSTLIISDPGTQYILEALSGVNSPGGAFETQKNRQLLIDTYNNRNPRIVADSLSEITDAVTPPPAKRLLVLSGRFFLWQAVDHKNQLSFDYNVWAPTQLSYYNYAYILSLTGNPTNFKLVYTNPSMAILELP